MSRVENLSRTLSNKSGGGSDTSEQDHCSYTSDDDDEDDDSKDYDAHGVHQAHDTYNADSDSESEDSSYDDGEQSAEASESDMKRIHAREERRRKRVLRRRKHEREKTKPRVHLNWLIMPIYDTHQTGKYEVLTPDGMCASMELYTRLVTRQLDSVYCAPCIPARQSVENVCARTEKRYCVEWTLSPPITSRLERMRMRNGKGGAIRTLPSEFAYIRKHERRSYTSRDNPTRAISCLDIEDEFAIRKRYTAFIHSVYKTFEARARRTRHLATFEPAAVLVSDDHHHHLSSSSSSSSTSVASAHGTVYSYTILVCAATSVCSMLMDTLRRGKDTHCMSLTRSNAAPSPLVPETAVPAKETTVTKLALPTINSPLHTASSSIPIFIPLPSPPPSMPHIATAAHSPRIKLRATSASTLHAPTRRGCTTAPASPVADAAAPIAPAAPASMPPASSSDITWENGEMRLFYGECRRGL